MPEPLKPVFQTVKQVNTFTATGQQVKTYVITFMVGDQGPFTEQIPGDQFNAPHVQEVMQQVADEINKIKQAG